MEPYSTVLLYGHFHVERLSTYGIFHDLKEQTIKVYSRAQHCTRGLNFSDVFGGDVRLGSSNPDPISDQIMKFSGTLFQIST